MTMSAPRSWTSCARAPLAVDATVRAEMLGELDHGRSEAAGPGVDENFLTGLDLRPFDQDLPGSQGDQWYRAGLGHGQGGRLERDVILVDRDVLGEGADAKVPGAGEHLVAHLEAADAGADLGDHTGDVVAEREGRLVLQKLLELAVPDHDVQRVDARCAHPDQYVGVADPRLEVRRRRGRRSCRIE